MKNPDNPFKVTVFTPTYNRMHTIGRLYKSLRAQTCRDFEWLVVDDGSTDGTGDLFRQWKQEKTLFPIVYISTPNGGKHRAVNTGVKAARGELFFIVDSDDRLTEDAIEKLLRWEKTLDGEKTGPFAGVAGLKGSDRRTMFGGTFSGEYRDASSLDRPRHHILGDKAEALYTDVLRRFPFPEFDGEKFLTESVVWNRIAHAGYQIRWFNDIIYLCQYRPDGMTRNIDRLYARNMQGYTLFIREYLRFRTTDAGLRKMRIAYAYRARLGGRTVKEIAVALGTGRLRVVSMLGLGTIYKMVKG